MKIIAGLGNPGPEYVFSRHNVGWLVADHLAGRCGAGTPRMQFSSMAWSFFQGGEKILLLKPLTYMNLSGRAVREAVEYHGASWEEVLVVCDDVALPFGKMRLRSRGSAGGHKGLLSVITSSGTMEVPRLRVGVGADPNGGEMASWVLGRFSGEEMTDLDSLLDRAADAVELWRTLGSDKAMCRINGMQ